MILAAATPHLPASTQCYDKFPFPDPVSALHGLHAIIKREQEKGNCINFTVYYCPHCEMYHVGSLPV